ncbi:MAG: wax ester/triacylglycerol synthase domain-containing protein [Pseudomonadota bacterium]
MSRLSLIDSMFLVNESRTTPMHVGGLILFTDPNGVEETDYVRDLVESLARVDTLKRPYGQIIQFGSLAPRSKLLQIMMATL